MLSLALQVAQTLITRSYLRDLSMLRAAFFNPCTPDADLRRVQQHFLEQTTPLTLLSLTVRYPDAWRCATHQLCAVACVWRDWAAQVRSCTALRAA